MNLLFKNSIFITSIYIIPCSKYFVNIIFSADFILNNNASLGYRQPNTTYTVGEIAYYSSLPTGYYLECTTAGTTSSSDIAPTSTIGSTVTDGTVVWTVCELSRLTPKMSSSFKGDFNDLKTSGIYNWAHHNNWETSHHPTPWYGMLQVIKNYNDIIHIGVDTQGKLISRYFIEQNNRWTDWRETENIISNSLNIKGYIVYASGLIIQWGQANVNNGDRINYNISFVKDYVHQVAVTGYSNGNALGFAAEIEGANSFKIYFNASSNTAGFRWIGVGN